jgi:hypothetical protein
LGPEQQIHRTEQGVELSGRVDNSINGGEVLVSKAMVDCAIGEVGRDGTGSSDARRDRAMSVNGAMERWSDGRGRA